MVNQMGHAHITVLLSAALVLASVDLPAARPVNESKSVKTAFAEATKGRRKVSAADQVAIYRSLREEPRFATNRAARILLTEQIIKCCHVPGGAAISTWDKRLQDEIPAETRRILDDSTCSLKEKIPFAGHLATWYASEKEDFAAAERVLDDLTADFPNARPNDAVAVELLRVSLYKWQDRFADAWKALEKVSSMDPLKAAAEAARLATEIGEPSRASVFWRKVGDESCELLHYASLRNKFGDQPGPKDCRARAKAYVENSGNPLDRRAAVVAAYFCSQHTEEEKSLRASVKDADFTKCAAAENLIRRAVQFADYALAYELLDLFGAATTYRMLTPVVRQRLRVVCLGALGRIEEAAALAENASAGKGVNPLDAAKFRVSVAILRGGDVKETVERERLTAAEAAEVWRTASRQALIWGDSEVSERCAAEHERLFAAFPRRSMKVVWFDSPIESIEGWRKVCAELDRQYCDLKYKMSMEDLVTDVATGRSPVEESALDADDARMEVSAACDRNGFHLFLRVEDPNARAIEDGFAGGMKTEMYFAQGADRPYACFGTSPRGGIDFDFQSQYDNIGFGRIDFTGLIRRGWFRHQTQFTDTDYVQHLFFAWENFYRELPGDGTVWRFECVSWTPKGGYTWAGSQGPHSCMAWGDIDFSLKPEQVTAIRRGLLCRTRGNWRKSGKLDVFEKWADAEIGDPAFSAACLKPLEQELATAMAGVSPEMSDEEVNRVYDAVLVKCRGIKHEIDALRKRWLVRKLVD